MTNDYGNDHTDEVRGPDPEVEAETGTREDTAAAEEGAGPDAGQGPDLTGG